MPNPRLLQTAERWMNKEAPIIKSNAGVRDPQPQNSPIAVGFPDNVGSSFLFSYDGAHKDFAQELIAKNNELFSGTQAEIPTGTSGEVAKMYILKRLGLLTALHKNTQLRSANLYPITPAQSEYLLKTENLTNPSDNWEDLALILYDHSESGENPQEAKALYQEISKHRQDLGLSKSDLEKKLIIDKVGEDFNFEGYGLNGGLPIVKQLEKGDRTLYLPDETENIGLRVLYRNWDLDLNARYWDLANSNVAGRVSFAPQGRSPKK